MKTLAPLLILTLALIPQNSSAANPKARVEVTETCGRLFVDVEGIFRTEEKQLAFLDYNKPSKNPVPASLFYMNVAFKSKIPFKSNVVKPDKTLWSITALFYDQSPDADGSLDPDKAKKGYIVKLWYVPGPRTPVADTGFFSPRTLAPIQIVKYEVMKDASKCVSVEDKH